MRENKYYCDRCKKEVKRKDLFIFNREYKKFVNDGSYGLSDSFLNDRSYDLCSDCLVHVYQSVDRAIYGLIWEENEKKVKKND